MEKPKAHIIVTKEKHLSLNKALKYIEDLGHTNFRSLYWHKLVMSHHIDPTRDGTSSVNYHFNEENSWDRIVQQTFNLSGSIWFDVEQGFGKG